MMLVAFLARRTNPGSARRDGPQLGCLRSLTVAQALEALVKNATPIRAQNEQIEKIIQGA